jgi:FG-GAP-like repeat
VRNGDFNGDGHSDILFQNASSGQLSIWEMNGTNVIGGGAVSANPGPSWKAIGTGDFNDDGHFDILFQNTSSGQVSIWEMSGNSLVGGGAVSPNPGSSWRAVGSPDAQTRPFVPLSGARARPTLRHAGRSPQSFRVTTAVTEPVRPREKPAGVRRWRFRNPRENPAAG